MRKRKQCAGNAAIKKIIKMSTTYVQTFFDEHFTICVIPEHGVIASLSVNCNHQG